MHKDNLEQIIQLRHFLHQHPNLSGQETETIETLQSFLRARTSLEIVTRDGWFYVIKRGTSDINPIAFRADMDALPMNEGIVLPYSSVHEGISHKCGHDGHMAALCGFALELEKIEVSRTVYLLFQPSEEIGTGARKCKDLILEKSISAIYALHNISGYPERGIVYRRGLTQPASEGLTLHFTGRQSHASAPEEGINPGPCIAKLVLYAQKLPALKEPGMALCTLVGMHCGNDDFGISAGSGSVSFTLRAEEEEVMRKMENDLLIQADSYARAEHLSITSKISDYFPETRNSDIAIDRIIQEARRLGLETIEMKQMWRASEDFGHYLKECPGAMFYIGNGENYAPVHTTEYDFNDGILETAVNMFLGIISMHEMADIQR